MTIKSRYREFLRNFYSNIDPRKSYIGGFFLVFGFFWCIIALIIIFKGENDIPIEDCCTTYIDEEGKDKSCDCSYNLSYRIKNGDGNCEGNNFYEIPSEEKDRYIEKTDNMDFPEDSNKCGVSIRDIINEHKSRSFWTPFIIGVIIIVISIIVIKNLEDLSSPIVIISQVVIIGFCIFGFYFSKWSNLDYLVDKYENWLLNTKENDESYVRHGLGYSTTGNIQKEVLNTGNKMESYINYSKTFLVFSYILYSIGILWCCNVIIYIYVKNNYTTRLVDNSLNLNI
jgi:hypothetical protein